MLTHLSLSVNLAVTSSGFVVRPPNAPTRKLSIANCQNELEGYIVPIEVDRSEILERLTSHFTGPKWGGWCSHGIDDQTADDIDQLIAKVAGRDGITVDKDKLQESWESWIHVKIQGQLISLVENSNATTAILTWPNSD